MGSVLVLSDAIGPPQLLLLLLLTWGLGAEIEGEEEEEEEEEAEDPPKDGVKEEDPFLLEDVRSASIAAGPPPAFVERGRMSKLSFAWGSPMCKEPICCVIPSLVKMRLAARFSKRNRMSTRP